LKQAAENLKKKLVKSFGAKKKFITFAHRNKKRGKTLRQVMAI